jgi:hypothetical protein
VDVLIGLQRTRNGGIAEWRISRVDRPDAPP